MSWIHQFPTPYVNCWFVRNSNCWFVRNSPPPLPSNRHRRSNGDCLEGKRGKLSGLIYAILCATIVHSAMSTHMNRPNSSLDWVLSHWTHFTVLRFIFVYVCIFCMTVHCMHVQYCNMMRWTWWDGSLSLGLLLPSVL